MASNANGRVVAGTSPPSLAEMVKKFKEELELDGNMKEVVEQAAANLGVPTAGLTLMQQAERCWRELCGDSGPRPAGGGADSSRAPVVVIGTIVQEEAPRAAAPTQQAMQPIWSRPHDASYLSIHPSSTERLIFPWNGSGDISERAICSCDCFFPPMPEGIDPHRVPQQLLERGLEQREWSEWIEKLRRLREDSALMPCTVFLSLQQAASVWLMIPCIITACLPLRACCEIYQPKFEKWMQDFNRVLEPKDLYVKAYTFEGCFRWVSFLCFALTRAEMLKMQGEPWKAKGNDIHHQQHGEALGCPVDAGRCV